MSIRFNKPYITGKEIEFIKEVILSSKIAGDGLFTKKCQTFFEERYNFRKVLLTTSCTDALEMASLLLDIKDGDEIIAPSYTFVSTVNAFVLRGAKIIFVDSNIDNPNIDVTKIEALITNKTKAIIAVHYAGIACDMNKIMDIANKYNLFVVEDAAQAVDSYYDGKPLGSIGHLGTFSFHETKNIVCGEGGMLVINDEKFIKRAEIIRDKGTNRSSFIKGEVDKYQWADLGSSYAPSDILAAFLYAQLLHLELIQKRRIEIWNLYYQLLLPLSKKELITLPTIPEYATNNAQLFYIVCENTTQRTELINVLKENNIEAVFHYNSLHKSSYYKHIHGERPLPMSDKYSDCLLRLPLYFELTKEDVIKICSIIVAHLTKSLVAL